MIDHVTIKLNGHNINLTLAQIKKLYHELDGMFGPKYPVHYNASGEWPRAPWLGGQISAKDSSGTYTASTTYNDVMGSGKVEIEL